MWHCPQLLRQHRCCWGRGAVAAVERYLLPAGYTHTHTRLAAPFPGLSRCAGTRKVRPIWILLKQETVSRSGISWAVCKSAPRSRQITTPATHHSVFLQAGCPSCRPTNSVKALKGYPAPTCGALSSKPAARYCSGRQMGRTDERMLDSFVDLVVCSVYYASSVGNSRSRV